VFLDGDDALLPWALDVYERIVQAKEPKMILGSMRWFEGTMAGLQSGDAPQEITIVDYHDYFQRDRGFGHSASAMVIARQAFEEVHGWLESFFPLEDVELALRLGTAGQTIQIVGPPTIWHRSHSSNSVNNVLSFIPRMEDLLRRERQGFYPGGPTRSFERRALIGGVAAHWVKRAAMSGLRKPAIKLLVHSSLMLSAAMARKIGLLLTSRQPCETIKM
jgi:hypothetical protein